MTHSALHVQSESLIQSLITQFSDVISDDISETHLTGTPMKIHLQNDSTIKPLKVLTARQIPLHWQAEAEKVIAQGIKNRIFTPVSTPTDWISPAFFVPKEGGKAGLRLVTDFTILNRYVQRPVHPFPSSLDILRKISPNATVFCKMDAVQGYFQIPLDEASSYLTTFLLPCGRYRYLRAPMGLCSSSDEWCRRSDEALHGLAGTQKLVDDILIEGKDLTQLQERIIAVLEHCRKYGLRISKKKFQIGETVKFAGFQISGHSVKPDPDKLKALSDFPTPKNITELRSFLGLANQLAHFVPDLAHMSEPLRQLLRKHVAYQWLDEHEHSFQSIIKNLTTNLAIQHFNSSLDTELLTDASRLKGLGFALIQRGPTGIRLIECGSRSLTETESRYATIELECLAILWAIRKCSFYLTGLHNFTVVTDHRPLLGIFSKPLAELDNSRLQRFREHLTNFSFDIKWVAGKQHIIADTLSRAPVFNAPEEEYSQVFSTSHDPAINRFYTAASKDAAYQEVITAILDGKTPRQLPIDHPAHLYKNVWDRLSIIQNNGQKLLVCDNTRIVIPLAARQEVLKLLHLSHSGLVKTKKTAQRLYYWPHITNDIKNVVQNCSACQKMLPSQAKEPLILSRASSPMSEVGADLFALHGKSYLLMVDRYSGYPFFTRVQSLSTSSIISHFKRWFLEFGYPLVIRTDGGPQFRTEFNQFCNSLNITHELSSPYNPQSNGLAEVTIKSVKYLLEKCFDSQEDFQVALSEWKATPRADGFSPSEMFFGRRLRTLLPGIQFPFDPLQAETAREDTRQKVLDSDTSQTLAPLYVGDAVLVQNEKTKEWVDKGTIISIRPSGRSYEVSLANGKVTLRNRRFIRKIPCNPTNSSILKTTDRTVCQQKHVRFHFH